MKKNSLLLFLFSIVLSTVATERKIAFLGLYGDAAPALEKTYERILREQLSVAPFIDQVDINTIEMYKKKINFDNETTISRTLVQSLQKFAPDTTLFIWGMVKKHSIRPKRYKLIRVAHEGELSIGLIIYSLSFKDFVYVGDIYVTLKEPRGFFIFGDVNKETHLSALDRADMLERLERESVQKSVRMIEIVTRNEILKYEQGLKIQKKNAPSLSDLFTIPSVAPSAIDTSLSNYQK